MLNPKSPKQTFDQFCKSELFEESQLIKDTLRKLILMQLRANHFLESLKVMKGISSHLMMRKKINIIFRTNEMAKQNQGNPIVGRYCGSHIHMYYLKKKQYQRKQYKHKCSK